MDLDFDILSIFLVVTTTVKGVIIRIPGREILGEL
jgi:hypothetical protein